LVSCLMDNKMYTQQVLDYLKKRGQEVDRKIALETGISLIQVHDSLKELEKNKKVFTCSVTTYEYGESTQGLMCRISGYIPPAAPGRKTTTK
jgi:hydroxymethylpyrimidine pyrophosphatase-like HAD family hydrolase